MSQNITVEDLRDLDSFFKANNSQFRASKSGLSFFISKSPKSIEETELSLKSLFNKVNVTKAFPFNLSLGKVLDTSSSQYEFELVVKKK